MKPVRVYVLIGSTLVASWLGMQAVHEAGHVIGATVTGGRVEAVCLHPLTLSHTAMSENPAPLVVVWAGPVFGVVAPVVAWAAAAGCRWSGAFLLRFFAGFCLVSNGAYIAGGSVTGIGDAGVLLRHGSSAWVLWLFGVVAVPAGLALWHRQARHFGLGPDPGPVSPAHVGIAGVACGLLIALGLLVGNC